MITDQDIELLEETVQKMTKASLEATKRYHQAATEKEQARSRLLEAEQALKEAKNLRGYLYDISAKPLVPDGTYTLRKIPGCPYTISELVPCESDE